MRGAGTSTAGARLPAGREMLHGCTPHAPRKAPFPSGPEEGLGWLMAPCIAGQGEDPAGMVPSPFQEL